MKTLLVALSLLFAPLAAHAQGCGPSNPSCIVPTAPVGTNNNQAASTAFVQNQAALVPSQVAPLLRSYIAGLTLSNDGTTPNSVLDIAAGVATDSTNAVIISLGAFTKSTGGAWVAGSGSNGMGNGLTISNSTWYHVCLANNSATPDVWFDTSAVCANRPGGISDAKFRRIGSFKTDASAHILAFTQVGDEFIWSNDVGDVNVSNLGTVATLFALSVPSGLQVWARFRYGFGNPSGAAFVLIQSPDETAVATNSPLGNVTGENASATNQVDGDLTVRTNTSQQIRAVANAASSVLQISTYGWIDYRGRFN